MFNNDQFIPESNNINNILNDAEYVDIINNLSESIYKYALATKGNFQEIQKIFDSMDDELKQNKQIINFLNLSESNEKNINNFFSDAKISFKNLKIVRKEYLSKIEQYINYLLSETKVKTKHKRQYSQGKMFQQNPRGSQKMDKNGPGMLDLILNLKNYIEIIGLFSQEHKENYLTLLNMIIKEFKKYENIDMDDYIQQINEMEKEIKNCKIIINKYKESNIKLKNYSINLEKKINYLVQNKDNIISSLNTVNNQLKEEVKKERFNSSKKDKTIKELKKQNNDLFKINKEQENDILSKDNKIRSLSEETELYKNKSEDTNKITNNKKDIINNLKKDNILKNNINNIITNNNNLNVNNNNIYSNNIIIEDLNKKK
jgi:hypothetical protein